MRFDDDEFVILETDAELVKPLRSLGLGRAYLTSKRFIWESTMPLIFRLPYFLPPREVVIDMDSIRHVRRAKTFHGAAVVITLGWTDYVLRPGHWSWLFLRKNPEIAQRWNEAFKSRGTKTKE